MWYTLVFTDFGCFLKRFHGRSESNYGRGVEDAEGDVEKTAVDT